MPYSSAVQYRFACVCTVPFGLPVEPDEYSQKPMSSAAVGAGDRAGACCAISDRSSDVSTVRLTSCGAVLIACLSAGANALDTNAACARLCASM